MSKSQELGLMELTPRGSRDEFLGPHKKKKNNVAPSEGAGSDTKQGGGSSPIYPHNNHATRDHRDHNGMGHLILEAAKNGNPAEVEALLRDGANPNVVDAGGKSPLHLALATGCSCDVCVRDAEACLILLLSSNRVNVNLQDETGQATALHLAVDNQLSKCAQMLISYGADVNLRNDQGESVVQLMAKKMPHCLLHLLNESVYIDQYDPHHEKCVVKIDLSPLLGHSLFASTQSNNKPAEVETSDKGSRSPNMINKPKKKKIPSKHDGEMGLLMDLLENRRIPREPLFTHPLTQIFLHLKWKRVRGLFWASLVLYLLWMIMYTSYVLQVYVFSCPCQLFKRASTTVKAPVSPAPIENEYGDEITNNQQQQQQQDNLLSRCEIDTGFSLNLVLIIFSTFLLLLVELGRLIVTPRVYLRAWLNLGHWILIICVFATTIPNLQEQTSISALQYQVAAFTVFLAWVFVLPQIGRLPSLSKYVEIFGHVVKCFGKFILTFASLFMGFALAFCILFFGDSSSPFASFFHSSVKVFVMMVGEMDYENMFYGENQTEQGPVMGHLLYTAFAILVCVILMNLFVGLTVSDIQKLERQAEFSRTCRLILEIFHLESALLSKRLPKFLRRFLRKTFLFNGTSYSFRPNDPGEKGKSSSSIPSNLSRETLNLAEASFRKAKSQRCFRPQNHNLDLEPELVEIQTYYPTMEKAMHGPPDKNGHNMSPPHPHHRHHSSTSSTSSSPSSQNSSPLETNSLDLDVNHQRQAHSRESSFRPWASCVDHTNYPA